MTTIASRWTWRGWVSCAAAAALVACGAPEDRTERQEAVARADAGARPALRAPADAPWPEARGYAPLAYDPIHGKVLLAAGQDDAFDVVRSVWALDVRTHTWERVADWAPHAVDMATFDVAAGKLIVYVGYDWWTYEEVHETWALDPETGVWENRHPAAHPPAGLCGCGSQLTYDLRAAKTVMFGGVRAAEYLGCLISGCDEAGWAHIETNDVWTYDYFANRWTMMPRPEPELADALPAPRNSHGLAYDPWSGRVVLFGGDNCRWSFGDTWAYDLFANRWTRVETATAPSARSYPSLAYDWLAGRTVLFGGTALDPSGAETLLPPETWTLDLPANAWSLASPRLSPGARAWNGIAYSLEGDAVVLFGGGADRAQLTNELWLYRTRAERWTEVEAPAR